ncbi:TIGR03905 family TSCPD domain-containing protein [Wukongibacter sp. M2B1]|uniref:TIGR03905 family TSCPD domain-containing protein n=1 Tax=Wukongibacter sp. M2B1 TaxID=3088895 RepID=UPI003D7A2AC7
MNSYITKGVCTRKITFTIDNELVKDVAFYSGCHGNLQGISSLIEGMNVHEAIKKLKGIKCGNKPTSCPDQLSKALEEHINNR